MLKVVLFKFNQNSSIQQKKILMEKAQKDIVDVEASPLLESSLSELMQQKIDRGKTNEANSFTIFRTPHNISKKKKNLFEPAVISIGPFHRGKKNLKAMEEHKWRFLESFLSRGDTSLDFCISDMKLLEEKTRRCYSETFEDLDSDAFVEMMLLDGCFLLEYFLKCVDGNWNSIFEVGWSSHFINRDLVLQENQIPFFIVEKLHELIGFNQDSRMIFVKYIAYFLLPTDSIFPDPPAETPDTIIPDPPAEIQDLLAAIRAQIPDSIISDPPAEIPDSIIPDPPAEIPDSIIPDPPAEIPDSIIPDPPAEIPDPPAVIPDLLAALRAVMQARNRARILAEIPYPPAKIHHLAHLCYHYLVPDPGIPVVLRSKSFDLTRIFCANRIKGFLHWFLSRVLKRISRHSTSRSLSEPLPNSTANLSSMVIPSATALKEAGLKFKLRSNPRNMLDISFEHGALKIPKLKIGDFTKPIFANLIAFEHSKYGKEHSPFGRFVHFLDCLVNTPNDVTILQQCGIIENLLGSEEELAHFLNQVTEGNMLSSNHYLAELYTEVNRYIESNWHRHRAKLIRDYFSNPWAIISLIAALILLVLTCVQSFYAVYAYKFPPSS